MNDSSKSGERRGGRRRRRLSPVEKYEAFVQVLTGEMTIAECARRLWRRPTKRTSGPGTGSPSGLAIIPARCFCTYSRRASFAASLETFGRLAALRVPLRRRRPIRRRVTPSRRVAAQLPRDRRRRPAQAAGDFTPPDIAGIQDRDLFSFLKAQITSRYRSQTHRRHPASLTEPPRPDRG